MPQRGKRFWRRLGEGLFVATDQAGWDYYLERHTSAVAGRQDCWLLLLPDGQGALLPTRYREEAMRFAQARLRAVVLVDQGWRPAHSAESDDEQPG
jgi:hypothetical protein